MQKKQIKHEFVANFIKMYFVNRKAQQSIRKPSTIQCASNRLSLMFERFSISFSDFNDFTTAFQLC